MCWSGGMTDWQILHTKWKMSPTTISSPKGTPLTVPETITCQCVSVCVWRKGMLVRPVLLIILSLSLSLFVFLRMCVCVCLFLNVQFCVCVIYNVCICVCVCVCILLYLCIFVCVCVLFYCS